MSGSKNGHPPAMAQVERFKQAARALECDEDEEAFKRTLRKVAKAPKSSPVKSGDA